MLYSSAIKYLQQLVDDKPHFPFNQLKENSTTSSRCIVIKHYKIPGIFQVFLTNSTFRTRTRADQHKCLLLLACIKKIAVNSKNDSEIWKKLSISLKSSSRRIYWYITHCNLINIHASLLFWIFFGFRPIIRKTKKIRNLKKSFSLELLETDPLMYNIKDLR